MMTFNTSDVGKDLIKEFETCELKAYRVGGAGNWTIGWGQEHALYPNTPGEIRVTPDLIITQQQADDAFSFFVHNIVDPLVRKHFNCETQEEHDACASWVYNIRMSKLERGEYSLPAVFNRKPRNFPEIVNWWIKYRNPGTNTEKGLYRRRIAELCLMRSWPYRHAWAATLDSDPWAILALAQREAELKLAPIPSEPDPPVIPAHASPIEEEPMPEPDSPIDVTQAPKKIEDSKTGKALNRAARGKETVTIGGIGTLAAALAMQVEAVGKTIEALKPETLLTIGAITCIGLIATGIYMWWSGRTEAYHRRLEQQDPKY